jgi:hypothetical protein
MRADDVEIGEPCPINLAERVARTDGESFHCDQCDLPVHVLSHMSEAAATELLARREREHLCVAFVRAPDGSVQFRPRTSWTEDQVVPTSRLRRMVRASALALSVAACSNDEPERVEPAELETVEQPPIESGAPSVIPPVELNEQGQLEVERDTEHLEVLGGPPPRRDEPEQDRALRVPVSSLKPIRTPHPPAGKLQDIGVTHEQTKVMFSIDFCVDEEGRVVDAELDRSKDAIARLYLDYVKRWRFEPYEVDGRKTRVCTKQRFRLDLERPA